MRRAPGLAVLTALAVACAAPGSGSPHTTPRADDGSPAADRSYVTRTVLTGGTAMAYRVYLPPGARENGGSATTADRHPVILFLHGSGERGTDGTKPTQIGLGPAIAAMNAAARTPEDEFPAIVVFPQAPPDSAWYGAQAEAALTALEQAIVEFGGDRQRVYLTGVSMGGYGALRLAAARPDRFAALAVVCGGIVAPSDRPYLRWRDVPLDISLYEWAADRLQDVPVWLFHGSEDEVIPAAESREVAAALRAAGGDVRYTEYQGVGHGCWDPAYAEPELWRWLFAQRR